MVPHNSKQMSPVSDDELLQVSGGSYSLLDAQGHEVKEGRFVTATLSSYSSGSTPKFDLGDSVKIKWRVSYDLKVLCNEQAILALKAGDPATHDRLVLEMADQMKDRDVIVLAQASTAYMEQPVAERSGVTTLSSPARCIAQLRKMLEEM